jgi:hypothetical protein
LIATRISIAKFERIQRNAWTEQTGPEMKQMSLTCAISEFVPETL